jgi:hypothetical protein
MSLICNAESTSAGRRDWCHIENTIGVSLPFTMKHSLQYFERVQGADTAAIGNGS